MIEAVPVLSLRSLFARRPQWIPSRGDFPGIVLAAAIGGAALFGARMLPRSPFVSDILLALVLGALLINTPVRHLVGIAPPSGEREPDRYAAGLRFTGKWVLRAGIILMGLKVQTGFFGHVELLLIAGIAAAALPSAFFVAHSLAAVLGVRRPMADLLAGGTMICGASAINAAAPVVGARREEQGLAIGVVFLFSIAALVAFRPIAAWLDLAPALAGLWSGLAVNDLSSAVAVGNQMGGAGGVMAAASKSARILLLAPILVLLSLIRREGKPLHLRKTATEQLPGFLIGYIALAVARTVGDRLLGHHAAWAWLLSADRFLVDLVMATVAAGIGLHLAMRSLLAAGPRALAVGGGTSVWMASLTLTMITAASRSAHAVAGLIGVVSLFVTYGAYRWTNDSGAQMRALLRRFDSGAPLALAEATRLLDAAERSGSLSEPFLRRMLTQLHPSIGELIPVRHSPLPHGEGCRWITYWEGRQGWALVALCREPGTSTPIHAHPHRLLGKAIEGILEELRFTELSGGLIELSSRRLLGHNELVETDGLGTVHVIRAAGTAPAIDLQLRGPETGRPGRRLSARELVDFATLPVGSTLAVTEEIDDRPGHGGEGASAGKLLKQ